MLPGLIYLGIWQLHRAEAKRAILEAYDQGAAVLVDVRTTEELDALPRYQRVRIHGRYQPARQVLLDNMPSQTGRPGYQVLTPFVLDGGGRLLVNRGWVPLGATRAALPNVDVAGEARILVGVVDALPRPGLRLGGARSGDTSGWPRVLNFPTIEQLTKLFDTRLGRYQVLLDPSARDGYERVWRARFGFGPERHVGYAVQWFALAAALIAIYIGANLKRPPTTEREPGTFR